MVASINGTGKVAPEALSVIVAAAGVERYTYAATEPIIITIATIAIITIYLEFIFFSLVFGIMCGSLIYIGNLHNIYKIYRVSYYKKKS